MRKLTLLIGLIVAVNILFAQGRREQVKERVKIKIEEYKDRLDLTEDQVVELKKVRESMQPELDALRADEGKSRSEKMRAHADIIEKREAEVARILDDEQLAELEVIKKEINRKPRAAHGSEERPTR
ncbi:MAG: hypothetical protein RLN88_09230 [Ekhidna sp.]|uniref:hypothetical protein n=1 Tax=Ekhidna sp. TaxID=2608089 RepID=UPI0032EC2D0C